MSIALIIVLFCVGIVLIVKGGDVFVDAASWIAEVSGIPKLIVGATIVSLATTLPEQLVSWMAAAEGKVDMSIGNAVGSVTANIGLIMAIGVICMPGAIRRKDYLAKSALMLLAAGLLTFSGLTGEVGLFFSLMLLAVFLVFMCENLLSAKRSLDSERKEERERPQTSQWVKNIVKFLLGAAGIVIGADLLVDNGSLLAQYIGISERIIGLTLVAVGTSLPELVTTITAIAKKQSALSVGNILGANIIDLSLILPLCTIVSGQALPVSQVYARFDLPVCLLVGCIAVIPAMIASKFQRWQGVVLLAFYGVYVALTCAMA